MTLATIELPSGRSIELRAFYAAETYGGLLEGVPTARTNARFIAELPRTAARLFSSGHRVHVVDPPRTRLEQVVTPRGEVQEMLPPVTCFGYFESSPLAADADALMTSALCLAWFQAGLDEPIAESARGALAVLDWAALAADVVW